MKTINIFALAIPAAVFLSGCVAHVRPVDVEYGVEYAPAPVYVEQQPYVVYGGYPHYYYEGRWYRNTPNGWGYVRSEPAELRRQRPYVQQAPPARRGNPRPNSAPPAHHGR